MRKILLLLIVSIIVIAGCTKYTPTSQYAPTTKEVGKEGGGTLIVRMSGVSFIPSEINVEQGDEIAFVNTDSYAHTVTIPDLGIDRRVSGGQTFTVKVDKTGTFNLQCTIHLPSMVGQISST